MTNATNRWLDKLAAHERANGGTGSDYALAQIVTGGDRAQMSKYRREVAQMGNDGALIVAQRLGVHPMVVLAEIAAEKSRDHRMQRAWLDAAKHYARKAAYLVAPVILTALHSPAGSEAAMQLCILCKAEPANDPQPPRRIPRVKPGRYLPLSQARAA